jgi:hypothetical protein
VNALLVISFIAEEARLCRMQRARMGHFRQLYL